MTANFYLPTEKVIQLKVLTMEGASVKEGENLICFPIWEHLLRTGDTLHVAVIPPGYAAEFVGTPELKGVILWVRVNVFREYNHITV